MESDVNEYSQDGSSERSYSSYDSSNSGIDYSGGSDEILAENTEENDNKKKKRKRGKKGETEENDTSIHKKIKMHKKGHYNNEESRKDRKASTISKEVENASIEVDYVRKPNTLELENDPATLVENF